MKKILLATTMLAGTAGYAAAEVKISGYAEVGIAANDSGLSGSTNAQFWTDVDVTFAMSGESDSGLSFGVSVDLDEAGNLGDTTDNNGTAVYISGAFGKLTIGDTDGAMDWAIADAGSLTSLADDHTTHLYWFGASGFDGTHDDQVARYEYSFGDFGVAVSFEQAANNATGTLQDDNIGIGATYSMDMSGTALKFGLAYQRGSDSTATTTGTGTTAVTTTNWTNGDAIGASVSAELAGGFSASLGYIKYDYDATTVTGGASGLVDYAHTGLNVTYKTGALAVSANVGHYNPDVGVSDSTYGLAVNYDLGGGAVVMAGYGSDNSAAVGNQSQYSIGLGLSF